MNTPASFLAPPAQSVLEADLATRIAYLQENRWIGYSQAKLILERMEDVFLHPRVPRMPNLLVAGDTNNGKSTILARFFRTHPPEPGLIENRAIVPVLMILAPPRPNEGRLYDKVLTALGAPFRFSDAVGRKQMLVFKLFRDLGIKVLVIDDIHNVLAGPTTQQRAFLNVVRDLSNELMISIIGAGTKEAYRAIAADPQLDNRFEPLPLPSWKLDNEYQRLLASFEKLLPFAERSHLGSDEAMAAKIFSLSSHTIGGTAKVLSRAAIMAAKEGQKCLTLDVVMKLERELKNNRQRTDQTAL